MARRSSIAACTGPGAIIRTSLYKVTLAVVPLTTIQCSERWKC
jgi:hypothetical protein